VRSRYAVLRAHPRSFTFSPASFSSQRLTYGSDTFPTSMGSRSSPRVTCTARYGPQQTVQMPHANRDGSSAALRRARLFPRQQIAPELRGTLRRARNRMFARRPGPLRHPRRAARRALFLRQLRARLLLQLEPQLLAQPGERRGHRLDFVVARAPAQQAPRRERLLRGERVALSGGPVERHALSVARAQARAQRLASARSRTWRRRETPRAPRARRRQTPNASRPPRRLRRRASRPARHPATRPSAGAARGGSRRAVRRVRLRPRRPSRRSSRRPRGPAKTRSEPRGGR
jgi:hypothetical protein